MKYPTTLEPTATEDITLASGETVRVAKATPVFCLWTGDPPGEDYGGKPILDFGGEPVFAELAILRAWQSIGWHGVWVDSFRKRFCSEFWSDRPDVGIPTGPRQLFELISESAPDGRSWDVFCWRRGNVLFSESKLHKKDKIRDTQRVWLAAALEAGVTRDAFLVVEWSIAAPKAAV